MSYLYRGVTLMYISEFADLAQSAMAVEYTNCISAGV